MITQRKWRPEVEVDQLQVDGIMSYDKLVAHHYCDHCQLGILLLCRHLLFGVRGRWYGLLAKNAAFKIKKSVLCLKTGQAMAGTAGPLATDKPCIY